MIWPSCTSNVSNQTVAKICKEISFGRVHFTDIRIYSMLAGLSPGYLFTGYIISIAQTNGN